MILDYNNTPALHYWHENVAAYKENWESIGEVRNSFCFAIASPRTQTYFRLSLGQPEIRVCVRRRPRLHDRLHSRHFFSNSETWGGGGYVCFFRSEKQNAMQAFSIVTLTAAGCSFPGPCTFTLVRGSIHVTFTITLTGIRNTFIFIWEKINQDNSSHTEVKYLYFIIYWGNIILSEKISGPVKKS